MEGIRLLLAPYSESFLRLTPSESRPFSVLYLPIAVQWELGPSHSQQLLNTRTHAGIKEVCSGMIVLGAVERDLLAFTGVIYGGWG